jgi:hypothetical protein
VTGSKGFWLVSPQAVEQKGAAFAVVGGQLGKGSNQRRITQIVTHICRTLGCRLSPFRNPGASRVMLFESA